MFALTQSYEALQLIRPSSTLLCIIDDCLFERAVVHTYWKCLCSQVPLATGFGSDECRLFGRGRLGRACRVGLLNMTKALEAPKHRTKTLILHTP
jgi:hypothetical protein